MAEEANPGWDPGKQNMPESFKACYEQYYSVVFKHVAYLTGNIQAAEDITQETFVRYFKCPPGHSGIGPWLSRVATNLAYNYIRDEKSKNINSVIIEDTPDCNIIPLEDIAIRDYEIRLTRKVLNRLKPRDRTCLLLKFSGYKYGEISEITGVEKASVGKVLARAQDKFRKMYIKEAGMK